MNWIMDHACRALTRGRHRFLMLFCALVGVGANASSAPAQSNPCPLYADTFDGPALAPSWVVTTSGAGGASATAGEMILSGPGVQGTFTLAALALPTAPSWTNYSIGFDYRVEPTAGNPGCQVYPAAEVYIRRNPTTGAAYLVSFHDGVINLWRDAAILEQQVVVMLPLNTWYHAQVVVLGSSLTVAVGGTTLMATTLATAGTHASGGIGFGAGWCAVNHYDNLVISDPSSSLCLSMSQPAGAGSLAISVVGGTPGAPYITALTFETMNLISPGTGWWGGLHISITELAGEVTSNGHGGPMLPFGGVLDANGAASYVLPAGVVPAWIPLTWAVTRTFSQNMVLITGTSNIASIDPM